MKTLGHGGRGAQIYCSHGKQGGFHPFDLVLAWRVGKVWV